MGPDTSKIPYTDIFKLTPLRVFSIDSDRPFLSDLVQGLTSGLGDDPFALSDTLIYVPTRRAVRALTEKFVEQADGPTLLPTIRALGDVDEDELIVEMGAAEDEAMLAPAISTMDRTLVLAQLVAAKEKAFRGHENWPAAIAAARELGKLLDSFYTEEVAFDGLRDLAPGVFADHWAQSLEFLDIVTKAWPAYLNDMGLMDPSQRRVALINAQAARWTAAAPDHPIVLAGTTASVPAVRRLAKVVAGLPKGAIILPGLDRTLDAKAWNKIDDPHPQAGLKIFLADLGVPPADVIPWTSSTAPTGRAALLSLALRPAEATDDWLDRVERMMENDPRLAQAGGGLSLVEADTEDTEAMAVAIRFREALETPEKTAMLVTPNRNLGRRVALKMQRWGVRVDDSGGVPFGNTPCGIFLRLVAEWLEAPVDPVRILAVLDHPLSTLGLHRDELYQARLSLDEGLRGRAPQSNFQALRSKLAAAHDQKIRERAAPIVDILEEASGPLTGVFLESLLVHLTAAERLAGGSDALWAGDDGDIGAKLLADLRLSASSINDVSSHSYADIFTQLTAGAVVRRRGAAHPRLSILGPLEARLQSANVVILGGLNEGEWPSEAQGDPFLSRPMRHDLGLPSPERRLGLASHDFAQLAAGADVMLTRARQSGGEPAKPSRWLVRLKNILKGADALGAIDKTTDYMSWVKALDDGGERQSIPRPAPRPPLEARPRKLFVTAIENWIRDPYSVYARYILGLRRLEDPGAPFSNREMGTILHAVFERAAEEGLPSENPIARLETLFQEIALKEGFTITERGFWSKAVRDALHWFVDFEKERRFVGAPIALEAEGAWTLTGVEPDFTIAARADRIDRLANGQLYIFDYKLGQLRSDKQDKFFSPQLPLTALIASENGFADAPVEGTSPIAGYAYLKMIGHKGAEKADRAGRENQDAAAAIDDAHERLKGLVDAFDDPSTPYLPQPHPEFKSRFGDYDQLSRRREWSVDEDEGGT